jgi:hypothetical protein
MLLRGKVSRRAVLPGTVLAQSCFPEGAIARVHLLCIRIDLKCAALSSQICNYSLPQFGWLLSAAPHFDLVIFAGDALDVASYVDFRAQIVVVTCINRRSSPTVRGSIGSAPLGGPP